MSKSRIEAFSDAVIAIAMTIMVLELSAPDGGGFSDIWALRYHFLIYFLSFFSLAIYWINHHHLFQLANKVDGGILWLNTALLFVLSLFPFTTAWVDEHLTSFVPEMTYGLVAIAANLIYWFLSRRLVKINGKSSNISKVLSKSRKSVITIAINVTGILIGTIYPLAIIIMYIISLIPWLIPDRRVEAFFKSI